MADIVFVTDLYVGNIVEHKGRKYTVIKKGSPAKRGRGGAFITIELRDVLSGNKDVETCSTAVKYTRFHNEEHNYLFLYKESDSCVFMEPESCELINVADNIVTDKVISLLSENMMVAITFCEDEIVGVKLPFTISVKVIEADPYMKGQTATKAFKSAIIQNGLKIKVPVFIEPSEKIILNTETIEYVERDNKDV